MSSLRRVVVTGLGVVSPLGISVKQTWGNLLKGVSGVGLLNNWSDYEAVKIPPQHAAHVHEDFDRDAATALFTKRRVPDNILFGLQAAEEALLDAGLLGASKTEGDRKKRLDPNRVGVAVGTGISGMEDLMDAHSTLQTKGYRRVSPFLIPNSLVNITAGMLSMRHNFRGPNHSVSTACATGAHSIGDAFRFIKCNSADVMLCGATDACISPVIVAGFARAKALANFNSEEPSAASRPFDEKRSGFVIAEGSAILVLEELEHALARGATIYSEIKGYGTSGDAHHITAPHSSGDGAFNAMNRALQEGDISPSQINYVNAHATSTPLGDEIECKAIARLLVENVKREYPLAVTSTKGATGHLLGAAGSIEALFTILSIRDNIVPPTLNLTSPLDVPFDLVAGLSKCIPVTDALTNSFGFGGTNVSLLFSKFAS
eukprot:m.49785 g.49785  ORF g.49785 m.49785 type:complete len:432 (-) comp7468_c0_seq2:67-1362(-)